MIGSVPNCAQKDVAINRYIYLVNQNFSINSNFGMIGIVKIMLKTETTDNWKPTSNNDCGLQINNITTASIRQSIVFTFRRIQLADSPIVAISPARRRDTGQFTNRTKHQSAIIVMAHNPIFSIVFLAFLMQ